jgi:glutamine amidotransferase
VCRHLASLRPADDPVPLETLLLAPPSSLLRQSWAPRRQRHGTVNADGFGVGWFSPLRPEPAVYRRAQPMWTDRSFASLAGAVASSCVLAAVRSATPPSPAEESATAPFSAGAVLLSHNGAVDPALVRPLVPPGTPVESSVDSALLWALVRLRLDAGEPLAEALAGVVRAVAAAAPSARLNLLATDGARVAATVWGDTLWARQGPGGVTVASEPDDDEPGWMELPDRSLVTADLATGLGCTPL